ncbi:MAG: serine/threonine protein kinase, partial [Ruminococcus sp.]|nr:serine/threonine protein kinase [Ruminococcus sp.]
MDKYTGKKLDGRYEIRELIGVGGMANVYHCYDTIDAREVAIKILKDEFLDNEDFIRRFKNESKAIAVLNHPNIVRVYDVSFGDMIQYIVMEYIDGITLKEYIDMQGVLDWKETVHLTTQILKALQHAHENGIVHRDIKPHNIMLLQDGTIKVTDFGIARFSSNATRTMTEQAIGSVHYIAPEQARGESTDGKTDIYSVGVMMYEMLTGKLPFDGDSAVSVALMQLQAKARRPREVNPNIPEGLEEITVKAMQKNPDDRYHSALEMLSDIERFRLNPGISFGYTFADDAGRSGSRRKTVEQKPEEQSASEEQSVYYDDDAPVRSPALSAIKGVIIAAVLALLVFGGIALYKDYVA